MHWFVVGSSWVTKNNGFFLSPSGTEPLFTILHSAFSRPTSPLREPRHWLRNQIFQQRFWTQCSPRMYFSHPDLDMSTHIQRNYKTIPGSHSVPYSTFSSIVSPSTSHTFYSPSLVGDAPLRYLLFSLNQAWRLFSAVFFTLSGLLIFFTESTEKSTVAKFLSKYKGCANSSGYGTLSAPSTASVEPNLQKKFCFLLLVLVAPSFPRNYGMVQPFWIVGSIFSRPFSDPVSSGLF